ncbi:hypothetical protein ANO11243_063340 [Dothideomycetidae sp. 11243]|nr:hypothetical protein ANO11243_063340 [fungal sp. No.11243]
MDMVPIYHHGNDRDEPKQKRLQVSVACEICRQRKAKCDGLRPECKPCQIRGLKCQYVAEPDSTRLAALKRRHEALLSRNNTLESLLGLLRDASSLDASEALDRIRAGISAEDILRSTGRRNAAPESPHRRTLLDYAARTIEVTSQGDDGRELSRRFSTDSVRERMDVHTLLDESSPSTSVPKRRRT